MTEVFDLRSCPMGPSLRKYFGISDEYRGEVSGRLSQEAAQRFARALIDHASEHRITDGAQLVDILEELVTMDMPLAALQLYEAHVDVFPAGDFRAQFHLGNAALLAGSLVLAEQAFSEAQRLVPAETAPYVNMSQLLAFDARFEEARRWLDAGLDVDPNHFGLWELLAWTLKQQEIPDHAKTIERTAREKNSWAGLSLAMDLVAPDEPERKLNVLEEFYAAGTIAEDFLVEYTAVLGQCGLFDRIPAAIWRVEVSNGGKPLSWKLRLHLAQAHLAANRFAEARASLELLAGTEGLPGQVRDNILPSLFAELEESASGPEVKETSGNSTHHPGSFSRPQGVTHEHH